MQKLEEKRSQDAAAYKAVYDTYAADVEWFHTRAATVEGIEKNLEKAVKRAIRQDR